MSNRRNAPEESNALAEACRELVLRQMRRAKGSADADDVAQDACAHALGVARPDAVRDPVHYLMRTLRNVFIDRKRKGQREAVVFHALEGAGTNAREAADPERILAGKQELRRVLATIDGLPPRCREAFTLHRFRGLSYAGIARRMGVSTGTVEKHIAEAMLRIGRSLRDGTENRP